MAKARKPAPGDLPGQHDPAAPLDRDAFLRAAQPTLRRLTEDLLARADASPRVTNALKRQHATAKQQQRTAEEFVVWRRTVVVQVAAAWLLSCVFIRVLEDRGLIHARIAGPAARDSETNFSQFAPSVTHREYLLTVFRELARLPAASDLFDSRHNLVWRLAPSDAACKELLALFRMPSIEAPAFRFGQADTRFLGDLYQELDSETRDFYALLQTPDFVESFILDHTLEPAIREYGIDNADVIDPTCGSGHFLLGAFPRFLDHLRRAHPAEDDRKLARRALDKIYGVDINPYAVSIARFRLFLKFIEVGQFKRLYGTPKPPIHVVPADSLLYGFAGGQGDLSERDEEYGSDAFGEGFNLEDAKGAREILAKRTYTAVVGNPPYITVKDAALREKYRKRYTSAAGQYALSAPFMERFFALGKGEGGFIGQITANSFMKREFGKATIEKVLRSYELTYIVNTSGAYIPGHGTPTIIVFGRNKKIGLNSSDGKVLAVLAKRGESGIPDPPANAPVWQSIVQYGRQIGFDNEYISVDNIDRKALDHHPWTLEGGGADKLKHRLESLSSMTLGKYAAAIGFASFTGLDDVFIIPTGAGARNRIEPSAIRPLVVGESIRDWTTTSSEDVLCPFDRVTQEPIDIATHRGMLEFLWPYRTAAENVTGFGGKSRSESGEVWWQWYRWQAERYRAPYRIAYAEVATHNHFTLDRGGRALKQTAPIIILPSSASENDHLALLSHLNSSVACFWMKQVAFNKGSRGQGGGLTSEEWEQFFQFSSKKLEQLPLPPWTNDQRTEAANRSRALLRLAADRTHLLSISDVLEQPLSAEILSTKLNERRDQILELESRMRSAQESLDWWIYSLFGLADPQLDKPDPPRAPGQRLSDIQFAKKVTHGAAGLRYFQLCRLPSPEKIAESLLPAQDPLSRARAEATEANPLLRLLETPTYKRTFREGFREPDFEQQTKAWLLDKIEAGFANSTVAHSQKSLSRAFASRAEPVLGAVYPDSAIEGLINEWLSREAVPFLAAFRYSASGCEKHTFWCKTWVLQRQADTLDALAEQTPTPENRHRAARFRTEIIPPPKYEPGDFREYDIFRLRGRLDVPKERFISYPGCASDVDQEPVYGWAGWDHLQRALALFQLYYARKDEAWTPERLLPMLAGLEELLPWVRQWHADARSPETGQLYHEYFDQVIASECAELGFTRAQLETWAPPERGAAKRAAKAAKAAEAANDDDTPAVPRKSKSKPAAPAPAESTDGEPPPKRRGRPPKSASADAAPAADAPVRKRRLKPTAPPASE